MRYPVFLGMTCLAVPCLTAPGAMAAPVSAFSLAPVWGDHAVIQRDRPIVVEGTAAPAQAIEATLGDDTARANSDAQGHFALTFAARPAGGAPLSLTVHAGAQQLALSDLLMGDVWLCSGQSNMELAVAHTLNAAGEIAGAKDDGLRLITVPKAIAYSPQTQFSHPIAWTPASPAVVHDFSAACYYMARDLRKALHVPIGAIHASWGGSQIRAWLGPEAGKAIYGAADMALLDRFPRDPLGAVTDYAPRWEAWYREVAAGSQPWRDPDALRWSAVPKISGWLAWEGSPLATKATGTIWLRRQVMLSKAQAAAGGVLALGILDDMDMTYVNGHAVGNSFGWDYEREYRVPGAYLHEGANEVMVAVTNSYADGGFQSAPDKLAFTVTGGERLPLAQGWRYSISTAASYPPRAPWDANGGIGVMHNGMIAPLGSLAVKGVAWYQGESDVGMPGYDARLTALIGGWRRQFGAGTDVLVVQLANYGPVQLAPGKSDTAALRDDQRRVVAADPHASLVSAIDLGERSDIHPANKQLLGQRLAMAAQGLGMPMPVSARREGSAVRVRFSGIEGGLHAWSGAGPLGFELCDGGACHYTQGRIDGDTVLLEGQGATVRYAWADSPVVNLFDGRMVPVPGFQLAVAAP